MTAVSQILGLPMLLTCLCLVPGSPVPADLLWGALAGVAGFCGIVLLYRALSTGAMAVAAPVTAVTAALIPMAVGLATDHRPTTSALLGAGCAVVAITLVSLGPQRTGGSAGLPLIGLALLAGAMFGTFSALLGQASASGGMWSLAAVRLSSIPLGVLLMLGTRTSWRLPARVLPWVAAAGLLDIGSNALFVGAAVRGHLSVVAAIASLYPASTVLLALAVDRERVRPVQVLGLALAAAALVLATA